MTALSSTTTGAEHAGSFADREPIVWITSVVHQMMNEASLARTPDIEDLVIISYIGLLDCPDATVLTQDHLLARCRQQLVVWAWEQGNADEPIPTSANAP